MGMVSIVLSSDDEFDNLITTKCERVVHPIFLFTHIPLNDPMPHCGDFQPDVESHTKTVSPANYSSSENTTLGGSVHLQLLPFSTNIILFGLSTYPVAL